MDKLIKFLRPITLPMRPSLALLVLRVVMGAAFLEHGYFKIQNPFGWMGQGAPVPGIFQFLAALSEFGGGLALILGLLTSIAMLGLGFTMIVATYMHLAVMKHGFVDNGGGPSYELPLLYFAIALVFIAVGPGQLSLDAKLFGKK